MKENERGRFQNVRDSITHLVKRVFPQNKPEASRPINPQEIEPYGVERTSTGIFCETKTITVHRKTRIAVERYQKDLPKTLAVMRKIEERQKEDQSEKARLFDEMRNVHFRQPA